MHQARNALITSAARAVIPAQSFASTNGCVTIQLPPTATTSGRER
jgi:hypothetical protein